MEGKIIPENAKHAAEIVYKENTFVITSDFSTLLPGVTRSRRKRSVSSSCPPGTSRCCWYCSTTTKFSWWNTSLQWPKASGFHRAVGDPNWGQAAVVTLPSFSIQLHIRQENQQCIPHLASIWPGLPAVTWSVVLYTMRAWESLATLEIQPEKRGEPIRGKNQALLKHRPKE